MRLSQLIGTTRRPEAAATGIAGHDFLLRGAFFRALAGRSLARLPLGEAFLQQIEAQLLHQLNLPEAGRMQLPQNGQAASLGIYDQRAEPPSGPFHLASWLEVARQEIQSYRQLPLLAWQIREVEAAENKASGLFATQSRRWLEIGCYATNEAQAQEIGQQCLTQLRELLESWQLPLESIGIEPGIQGAEEGVALAFPVEGGEVTYGKIGSGWQEQSLLQAPVSPQEAAPLPLEKVHTPGASTIAELATFLDISPRQTAKVVLYTQRHAEPALVMVVVRGDHSVNETAVRRQLGVADLQVATEVDILAAGAVPGYASPIGLDQRKLRVLVDAWVAESPNLAAGANEAGYHFRNSNYGRDYEGGEVGRFALAEAEQLADQGWHQAVEVARYLPIGSEWSAQSDTTVMSEQGKPIPLAFGYVRVDLSQLLLVAAARHQDEQGLCWPAALSPFSLQLLSLADGEESIQTAEKLYAALSAAGYRVLYDDRSKKMAGPGVKFKDADLRGIPLRITVAKKALAQGGVEWKLRSSSEREIVPLGEVLDRLAADL